MDKYRIYFPDNTTKEDLLKFAKIIGDRGMDIPQQSLTDRIFNRNKDIMFKWAREKLPLVKDWKNYEIRQLLDLLGDISQTKTEMVAVIGGDPIDVKLYSHPLTQLYIQYKTNQGANFKIITGPIKDYKIN